jgi:hypothetical protein
MSAITSLDKEIFENLVKTSKTWQQVMLYFVNNHGYKNFKNNKTAKNRCIKEKISFDHFHKTKIELTKIQKNYNSSDLKKQLYKEGLLEEKCSECGLGNVWQGKPLVLQIDHIDGDHYNNELSNLRILCNNCHSQTKNFCGRNINKALYECKDCKIKIKKGSIRCKKCSAKNRHANKKDKELTDEQIEELERELEEELKEIEENEENEKKKCVDCNKEINKNSTRCNGCSSKKFNKRKVENRPSLEQLEKDLETMPMTKVGAKYGVTDNSVRKWIKNYKKELGNDDDDEEDEDNDDEDDDEDTEDDDYD